MSTPAEQIRAEIEERRPQIRRAEQLAQLLLRAAGGDPLPRPEGRPTTTAGIAIARAVRRQEKTHGL